MFKIQHRRKILKFLNRKKSNVNIISTKCIENQTEGITLKLELLTLNI